MDRSWASVSGEDLLTIVCNKLKGQNIRVHDGDIVRGIRSLSCFELWDIANGKVKEGDRK